MDRVECQLPKEEDVHEAELYSSGNRITPMCAGHVFARFFVANIRLPKNWKQYQEIASTKFLYTYSEYS